MLPNVALLSLFSLLTTFSLSGESNNRWIIRTYKQKRDKSNVVACTDRASAIKRAIVDAFLMFLKYWSECCLMISNNWSI